MGQAREHIEDPQSTAEPVPPIRPFGDIPGWIWRIFLCAWGALFALFILFFTTNSAAAFVITIAALFAMMAFGLPLALTAQSTCEDHKCGEIISTRTGPLAVRAAATQILLIPIAAVIGLIAFITFAM